jgi:hypothetical protein
VKSLDFDRNLHSALAERERYSEDHTLQRSFLAFPGLAIQKQANNLVVTAKGAPIEIILLP